MQTLFAENTFMKNLKYAGLGFISGIVNGLFGAAGGVIAVELLKRSGIKPKKAHATSIAIILALSIVSAIMYLFKGALEWQTALKYIFGGLAGALVGATALKKVPNTLLRRIFGVIIIISAVRMLMNL